MRSLPVFKPFFLGVLALAIFSLTLFIPPAAIAEEPSAEQRLEDIRKKIEETEKLLKETQNKQVTLKNEIGYQNNQIQLTALKIEETEEQIEALSIQINTLEVSLSDLSEVFAQRVVATYKLKRLGETLTLLLSSNNVSDFISRFYYLQKIQQNDRETLVQMQTAQTSYEGQREKREELKTQLESQKTKLASQKNQKEHLLQITKSDEKKFQELLAAAKSELEAIQAIIAGKGSESKVGGVSGGQHIASIIQGASCNSSGAHVHFITAKNGTTQNPLNYLKPGISYKNCSGGGGCSEGDPFNPSGDWDWPINPTVEFNQGYGATWAVNNTWVGKIYNFHNGIDISSDSSSDVKAVKSGTLYRGSYGGSNGCQLRYVRVDHDDSDIDTFYLHINY
ncbi:MAG: hypothetical protein A2700_01625 [Candidatus Blackburnbacteria bacterium RIFCSPHIGHO2_01_FULL_44_64]|uniref:Peptidoglycan hydrolase PcsB coiled-coil domain-containing protein n=1 Tax=Candidatus Blackburnbacteria bacterium RIFCSPHIGHO2_02_FULL_44_20 TaxID=1797516 RepID=A0A1G1V9E7_9BACT|nr:MAG: hypothetical protein A2700_01625 [Candidatus Blackburnbacteria bacterium RIFCSPHIGHO2_01_FULL_44_64]OGY11242.1 MAG: hypothetical protein A3E16_01585 [Candidatus Blackburnbacteria bacterium RIFCSPHIGHO2_12_FULL_44_25]OGY11931.1 MAG: hypothetical protein A3D26_02995 [Candidatus Blackburnbacteria bacterium RIFCSPHIGHO2_02_FULL_44_20]OGY14044.1 MAG: hypothetical protein A3A62_02935 [Candidatus Blackburnbacteria bacterium RIFCSPLOWO2_01_FULL_44_43]